MKMRSRSKAGGVSGGASPNLMLFWGFLVLVSNQLILPVASANSLAQQKNFYYSPANPHTPSGVSSNPSHAPSKHGSPSPTRHHDRSPSSTGGQSNCGVPPASPPPSGGGGCHCLTPPSPSSGSGGSGGYYGHHPPTPKTPSRRSPPSTPLVPSPPYEPPVTPTPRPSLPPPSTGGGGGYYGPPSTPTPTPTPTTPSTPLVPSPPLTPIEPAPPLVPVTPSPVPFDPNSPPFPCSYWGSHPALIFGVLGWWGTVGGLLGMPSLPGLNAADYSVQDILNNPRRDAYTSLYREATAAFLNSMAGARNFPFTSNQVKTFVANSLHSDKAAASQARLFRLANEGKLKSLP